MTKEQHLKAVKGKKWIGELRILEDQALEDLTQIIGEKKDELKRITDLRESILYSKEPAFKLDIHLEEYLEGKNNNTIDLGRIGHCLDCVLPLLRSTSKLKLNRR